MTDTLQNMSFKHDNIPHVFENKSTLYLIYLLYATYLYIQVIPESNEVEKYTLYVDSRTSDVQMYFTIVWYKSTEKLMGTPLICSLII